jgi:hypothetical protein
MKTNLYCPHCGSTDISVYKDTFECTKCKDDSGVPLEFYKKSISKFPDKEILTIQEMATFTDVFEELRDYKKRKKFFESLHDDDVES